MKNVLDQIHHQDKLSSQDWVLYYYYPKTIAYGVAGVMGIPIEAAARLRRVQNSVRFGHSRRPGSNFFIGD